MIELSYKINITDIGILCYFGSNFSNKLSVNLLLKIKQKISLFSNIKKLKVHELISTI